MRYITYVFFLFISSLVVSSPSEASISFTNGKWESTFNCSEWSQGETLSCDDLRAAGGWTCNDGQGSYGDQITSSANYPDGAGGRGFRHWQGDGINNNGGGLYVYFDIAQPELWIRWYHRYEAGFQWLSLNYDKLLYIYANSSEVIPEYKWSNDIILAIQGGGTSPEAKNKGWQYVMNGSASDGQWHVHEVYLKMDTNGSNGIGRYWLDGELIIDNTSVNFSGGDSTNQQGWYRFLIGSNQREPSNGGCMAVDYDDFVVYTSTPPNVDSFGNPFIGLVNDGGSASPSPSPSVEIPDKGTNLLAESFEDNSWTSRGWYDGTDSTGIATGGQAGNALKWFFAAGDTRPDLFSAIRRKFTAVDEFLMEYYVRLDTGWIGSGQDYHPHYIYVSSSQDSDYQALARSNSMLYFESWTTQTSPYTHYPVIAHQDMYRVNTSFGSVPNDLVSTTEDRSANNCNTPYSLTGATSGTCYSSGTGWYSSNTWRPEGVSIAENSWTKITAHVKMNTFTDGVGNFDGIMRLWMGDTLAMDNTNVLYAAGAYQGATWDKIVLAPWIGDGSPTAQSMWLDELSVWTVSSGSSVLTAPQDFRVVQ